MYSTSNTYGDWRAAVIIDHHFLTASDDGSATKENLQCLSAHPNSKLKDIVERK